MHINPRTTIAIVLITSLGFALQSSGQLGDKSTLVEQRNRLAKIQAGISAEQVLKKLGKPDEVRRLPNEPEIEQWAYGTMAKGMFARVGIVNLDRAGKVLSMSSPDLFSGGVYQLPERVQSKDDTAVDTPSKMSCHISSVKYTPSEKVLVEGVGILTNPESVKMTVTLKNAGPKAFEKKHDAANCLSIFLLVEFYDADGVLLFRDDYLRYHSTLRLYPAKWPVLSVPAGREKFEETGFNPDEAFGSLPAGKYSIRVYFPFEKEKYYPSNLVHFQWRERGKK